MMERDPLEYVLNRMEAAAQSGDPAGNGYGPARKELLEGIVALRKDRDRLKKLLNRDHTGLASALNKIQDIIHGYGWIPAGEWGSYQWEERTENNFRAEVGRAFVQIGSVALTALSESGTRANAAFIPDRDRLSALVAAVEAFGATTDGYMVDEYAKKMASRIIGSGPKWREVLAALLATEMP